MCRQLGLPATGECVIILHAYLMTKIVFSIFAAAVVYDYKLYQRILTNELLIVPHTPLLQYSTLPSTVLGPLEPTR